MTKEAAPQSVTGSVDGRRHEPTIDELESLFVNNDTLDRIKAYLNRFNPISVMRMEHMEIRHSAILAWLLSPKETHGFGDHFLKAFIAEALRGNGDRTPSSLAVAQADMRDSDVRREWNNIDVLVISPKNGWAFVIENKFHSAQHGGQLKKYRERIEELLGFENDTVSSRVSSIRGIFLTLGEETPEDETYATIRYETICKFLKRYLQEESYQLSSEIRIFLSHYVEILEVATGMSEERTQMERLARLLYREHRKVLDFVVEHGAGSDFALAARSLFGENPDYLEQVQIEGKNYAFNALSNSTVSFIPEGWYHAFGDELVWPGCEHWWAGYPLIAWFEMWSVPLKDGGTLKLHAEVGPLAEYVFRKGLIERIRDAAQEKKLANIRFQSGATDEKKLYSKFLKANAVHIEDAQDVAEIESRMKALLRKFVPEFDAVAEILPEFTRYGRVEE